MSYFSRIGFLSDCSALIISALDSGLTGEHGTIAIHASKKGLRITINGSTLAAGKTPDEFSKNYHTEIEKAKKGERR